MASALPRGTTLAADWRLPLLLLPGVVLLSGVTLRQHLAAWQQDAGWAWVNWTSQAQIIGPVFGAAACWVVVRSLSQGRGSWLASGSRGRGVVLAALLPTVVLAVLVLLGSAAWVAVRAPSDVLWTGPALLNAAGVLLSCLSLGAIAGRVWPSVVAPGVVAVGLWGLAVAADALPRIGGWLGVDGASQPMVGYLPTEGIALHRVLAALAVSALAVVALHPAALGTWRRGQRLALLAAGSLSLALVLGTGWFAAPDDVQTDPGASPTSCAPVGAEARMCVLPGHQPRAAAAAAGLAALDEGLRSAGLASPGTYRETSPHEWRRRVDGELSLPVDQRLGAFSVSLLGDARLDAPLSVLNPPECLAAPLAPQTEERLRTAQAALVHWALLLVAGQDPVGGPAAQDFDRLDERERQAFVQGALPAVLACDADRVPDLRPR